MKNFHSKFGWFNQVRLAWESAGKIHGNDIVYKKTFRVGEKTIGRFTFSIHLWRDGIQ